MKCYYHDDLDGRCAAYIVRRLYCTEFAWLYPEYVPAKNQDRWTTKELVLPNRSKHFTEPSLRGHGVGCSTQGIHGDWLVIDDPIGEAQLD